MADVRVYVLLGCPYCARAKRLLQDRGAHFTEIPVDGDRRTRDWLKSVTGSHTLPQVFIDNRPVGGASDLEALDRSGRLVQLLRG